MNHSPRRICLALSAIALCATTGLPAYALEASPSVFSYEYRVPDSELALMRGGFLAPNGMNISFGLTTATWINGVIQSNLNITGNNLSTSLPANMQQMIQVGQNNTANLQNGITSVIQNHIVTIIQNTASNAAIQHQNILNMTVNNMAMFRTQQAFQNALFPMALAAHR